MSPARIMSANRLAKTGHDWSRSLGQHSGTSNRQWVTYQPRSHFLWVTEQIPGHTYSAQHDEELFEQGYLAFTGTPIFSKIRNLLNSNESSLRLALFQCLQKNITTLEEVRAVMDGNHEAIQNHDCSKISTKSDQVLAFRGDLDQGMRRPFGVVETTITLTSEENGVEVFEAHAGPPSSSSERRAPFSWSKTFPNASHHGQPNVFDFKSVMPVWVW